ncbi:hypothetical protein [Streptomyces chrestomyceticus]|uniref:hypothetical protein n=1 Tax=Streptomyces chrestomyceticus TaxID=68185 RepID=UPI0019D0A543|nr:hypothetical protein [Streptomyces chrestomyceticus]
MPVIKRALAVVAAAAGLAGVFTVPAAATTVIGAGNSAHDNHCANNRSARSLQSGANAPGGLVGGVLTLSLSAPANQCGDLGLPKEDKADQPAENMHVDVAE